MQVTIKQGNHYPNLWTMIRIFFLIGLRKTRTIWFIPGEGCDVEDTVGDMRQSNKAFGQTHGLLATPRSDSTRLVFRGLGSGSLECFVMREIDKRITFPIVYPPTVLGFPIAMTVSGWRWPAFSYYGGDNPATVDTTFTLRRKK